MSTGIAWCPGRIVMRGEWGDKTERVRNGQTCRGLGLSLGACVSDGWSVTHLTSGEALGRFKRRRCAKEFMKRLLEFPVDWLADKASANEQGKRAKLGPKVQQFIKNPYPVPLRKRKAVKA